MNKLTTKADLHDKLKYAERLLGRFESSGAKVFSVPVFCIKMEEFRKEVYRMREYVATKPIEESTYLVSCLIRRLTDAALSAEAVASPEMRA